MRVVISGSSGSLGRALLRRLTQSGAERIVGFSRDEQRRAELVRDFGWHPGVRILAGDVRDPDRLVDIFRGCDTVIHAAARKVVSAFPDEPREMLLTNVLGTQHVIEAAKAAGVRKLLFISSDKCCQAENVYGVTKALAEHLVISGNAQSWPVGLRMGVLRYGNVLASRGSVLSVWRGCIERGEPLPVSDYRMTRFWLTLGQAVELVLQALSDLRGGEVFVPKLPAAPLVCIAEALAGSDYVNVKPGLRVIGIRPGGEKLHEVLLSAAETRRARMRNSFIVVPPYQSDQMWDNAPWLGEPVPETFVYSSETAQRLDVDEMRALIARADQEG